MEKKSFSQIDSDKMVEILKNQLYFAVIKGMSGRKIKSTVDAIYFCIDDEFQYLNYFYDFGPYNISFLYKYCTKLNKYLQYSQGQKRVVHCTSTNPEKKSNAAFLMGGYCIVYLKYHPADVAKLLMKAGPYKQFMDASQIPCPYTIKLDFFFNAVAKAVAFNFFNFNDFDVVEYDMYGKIQFGDMNWLVPRKFLAFIGPNSTQNPSNGHPPNYYIKYFLKNDIKTVIRLNNKMYDSNDFSKAGITHFDLIYPDGSTPSRDILTKFLQIAESAPAAIAVHCKAGLGRTGSLIGAYIIKHYKMTAKEAIAWMRICRPGSVIGQQQLWLEKLEPWLWKCGTQYRCKNYGDGDKIPRHKFGIYSQIWPAERSKILNEARRKYCSNQYSASDPEHLAHTNRKFGLFSNKFKQPALRKIRNIKENSCFEDISDFLTSVYGLEKEGKQQNHTMPNIRLQTAETRQTPSRIVGNSNRNYNVTGPPIQANFLNVQPGSKTGLQGDNEFKDHDQKNLSDRSERSTGLARVVNPYSYKIDCDTDTSDYVRSYIEERSKKKALYNEMMRVSQGDKLLEKKFYKSARLMNPVSNTRRNDGLSKDAFSGIDVKENSYVFSHRR